MNTMRTFGLLGLLVLCCTALAHALSDEQWDGPAALDRLVAGRAALHTGRLRLSVTDYQRAAKKGWPVRTIYHTARFADERRIWVNHGDDEGVVALDTAGQPSAIHGRQARYRFEAPSEIYERSENALSQVLGMRRNPSLCDDVRTLGVHAGRVQLDIFDAVWRDLARNPVAPKFDWWEEGGLHLVRVRRSVDTVTYWLDPERDWSAVKVRQEHDAGGWNESRSALERQDGAWFPVAVEYYSSAYRDGREPASVVQVLEASFNRADHPQELTVHDIGLEPGMDATLVELDGTTVHGKWDGQGVVDAMEFFRRLNRGEIAEGPNLRREVAKRGSITADEATRIFGKGRKIDVALLASLDLETLTELRRGTDLDPEALWEAYVRRFIQRYRLNAEQSAKALAILRDCQERARRILAARRPEIERLERRLETAAVSGKTKDEKTAAKLKQRRQELRTEIENIFSEQLKPRLDRLPTREQRTAVEAPPTPKK
ncbi:MAG: hypothetical protein ABIG44_09810 [Planctomycetota bacterium]